MIVRGGQCQRNIRTFHARSMSLNCRYSRQFQREGRRRLRIKLLIRNTLMGRSANGGQQVKQKARETAASLVGSGRVSGIDRVKSRACGNISNIWFPVYMHSITLSKIRCNVDRPVPRSDSELSNFRFPKALHHKIQH